MDMDQFYACLLSDHKTYVGRGRWFEESDRSFRLGFGWPRQAALQQGLQGLLSAAKSGLE
jgi:DNA-binding transcriptional MocR family regulator